MVSEARKQSMAWMEHGLQISLKSFALSMEDKMAAGAIGRATNYGWDAPVEISKMIEVNVSLTSRLTFIDGSESFTSVDL